MNSSQNKERPGQPQRCACQCRAPGSGCPGRSAGPIRPAEGSRGGRFSPRSALRHGTSAEFTAPRIHHGMRRGLRRIRPCPGASACGAAGSGRGFSRRPMHRGGAGLCPPQCAPVPLMTAALRRDSWIPRPPPSSRLTPGNECPNPSPCCGCECCGRIPSPPSWPRLAVACHPRPVDRPTNGFVLPGFNTTAASTISRLTVARHPRPIARSTRIRSAWLDGPHPTQEPQRPPSS